MFSGGDTMMWYGLELYYMLKNLFELIALEGDVDGKTLGMSACTHAHMPLGEIFTTHFFYSKDLTVKQPSLYTHREW